ncbi:MAG: WbqC family protein [Candidatus Kapaibacterium sp.]
MTAAILQSNYVPWKGYFDIINKCDKFIFYDETQYTKNDWRNRNIIKTKDGLKWISVPVKTKGKKNQMIMEAEISDPAWKETHWKTICHSYSKAPFFKIYEKEFEEMWLSCDDIYLSNINYQFIKKISYILEIDTKFYFSSEFKYSGNKSEKLLDICREAGADRYLTGPKAKDYLDESIFEKNGIEIEYMNYGGYPEYEQLYPPFKHAVSIIDLLFSKGPDAEKYMKSFNG